MSRITCLLTVAFVCTAAPPGRCGETRVDTPAGTIVVTTHDADVSVTVQQGGKRLVLEDAVSGTKLVLVDGLLEQKVGEAVAVSTAQFSLKRGTKVLADIRPEPGPVANPPPGVVPVTSYQYDPATGAYRPITTFVGMPPAGLTLPIPTVTSESKEPPVTATGPQAGDSEQSLLDRADEALRAKEYDRAITLSRELQRRFPDRPTSVAANRLVGLCYWSLATQEDQRAHKGGGDADAARARRDDALGFSRDAFLVMEHTMLAWQVAGRLTADDAVKLKQASFWGADADFFLGRYDIARAHYAALAIRYEGKPEELIAHSQVRLCLEHANQSDRAKDLLARMKERFPQIKFELGAGPDVLRRDYWEKWLAEAAAGPARPGAPPLNSY